MTRCAATRWSFYPEPKRLPIDAKSSADAFCPPRGTLGVAPNQGDTKRPCLPDCDPRLNVSGGCVRRG